MTCSIELSVLSPQITFIKLNLFHISLCKVGIQNYNPLRAGVYMHLHVKQGEEFYQELLYFLCNYVQYRLI